jgi:hypothetical protein
MENNLTAVKNKRRLIGQSCLTSKLIYTKLINKFIAKRYPAPGSLKSKTCIGYPAIKRVLSQPEAISKMQVTFWDELATTAAGKMYFGDSSLN